jgi:hypothetical protein
VSYETSLFIKGPTGAEIVQLLRDRLDTHPTLGTYGPQPPSIAHVFGKRSRFSKAMDWRMTAELNSHATINKVSFTLYAGRLEPEIGRELCRSLARTLGSVVCRDTKAECLVVEELQRILGEFRSET